LNVSFKPNNNVISETNKTNPGEGLEDISFPFK